MGNPEDFTHEESSFEEELKGLPNDLGGAEGEPVYGTGPNDDCESDEGMPVMLAGVHRFDNTDLQLTGNLTPEELGTLVRLFPEDVVAEQGAIGASTSQVKELVLFKIYKLCGIIRKQYDMRVDLEAEGADTDGDLMMSMLSIIGELGRLRTMLPKLIAAQE